MTRDDPTAFAPPPAFGPFRVLHQIGVGALGPVFRTYEPTRDRLVAVKVFRLDITPEQSQALADELSKAADAGLFHPSIVEPIAAGVEGTVAYRAEEYVAGESMDVAIRHYAPSALDKALPFLTQLAGAIDFARAAGVGHGALHLRDIFVTPDEARASGFGVVDALERVGIRAPVRRPYSAPERIAGEPWGTPADVFSLAAIAYELLTGRRPAGTGEQIGALGGDTVAEHAGAIRAVLARAMDDDPARRYPSALGFASALEAAARGEHVTDALRDMSAISAVTPIPPAVNTFEDEPEPEPAADAADYNLVRDEPPADSPQPGSLFDDDAATGLEMEPRPEPFADEPDRAAGEDDLRVTASHDDDYEREREVLTQPEMERPRPAMLPLAMTAILCLLIGFAAGYAVGGRDDVPAAGAATGSDPAAPQANTAPTGEPQPVREFSEQAVTPPPTAAPQVPGDEPRIPERSAARPDTPAAATPAARTGSISIRSSPSRAPVRINGKWSGRTPLTLDNMKFGPYTVRVVQPGYAPAREDVTLSASDPARTLSFRLQRNAAPRGAAATPPLATRTAPASPERGAAYSGVLYVDSRPRGATILIDGTAAGTTPARIPDVAIGSHVVRLELADHRAWTASTRVAAGQETRVTGSLERIR